MWHGMVIPKTIQPVSISPKTKKNYQTNQNPAPLGPIWRGSGPGPTLAPSIGGSGPEALLSNLLTGLVCHRRLPPNSVQVSGPWLVLRPFWLPITPQIISLQVGDHRQAGRSQILQ
jgi:hypothetical protein